jgi:Transcription factor WhiB
MPAQTITLPAPAEQLALVPLTVTNHRGNQFVLAWERWMLDGACSGHPSHWWYLDDDDNSSTLEIRHYNAMEICRNRCPVRRTCIDRAVQTNAQGVIRGGYPLPYPVEWHNCAQCDGLFLRRSQQQQLSRRRRYCYRCHPGSPGGSSPTPGGGRKCRKTELSLLALAAIIAGPCWSESSATETSSPSNCDTSTPKPSEAAAAPS